MTNEIKPVRLDFWSVVYDQRNPYIPPEGRALCLKGVIGEGHPHKPPGSRVVTSGIKTIAGRLVTTGSGTVYQLGRVNRKYRAWMKEKQICYDAKNPIKDKRSSAMAPTDRATDAQESK